MFEDLIKELKKLESKEVFSVPIESGSIRGQAPN